MNTLFPEFVQTAAYFDPVNFAKRIKADWAVTTGSIDTTCPSSSVYAAYSLMPPKSKRVINGVANGHEGPRWNQAAFVGAHMARVRGRR